VYYYVVESVSGGVKSREIQRVKLLLGELGILGEFALASPARSVEELAVMGLEKGFTTIVAIGGGRTVNKVASAIQGHPVAFGIIPLTQDSLLHTLIGTNDVKSACEALKFRRLQAQNLLLIEPNKYLLTGASVHFTKAYSIELEMGEFSVDGPTTDIYFTNGVQTRILNRFAGPNVAQRTYNWLTGRKVQTFSESVFHTPRVRFTNPANAPVIAENEIIAKTPIVVRVKRDALQLIVAKHKQS